MGNINQKNIIYRKASVKEAMIVLVITLIRNNFFASDFAIDDRPSPLTLFEANNNVEVKTKQQEDKIRKAFKKSLLFFSLDDDDIQYLIDCMDTLNYEKGSIILEQNICDESYYFIKKGMF